MSDEANRSGIQREEFPDGSQLILESRLARTSEIGERAPANYGDPPPPPAEKVVG